MSDTIDVLRVAVSAQLPITAFLAVLMWSLHARLRRQEFNIWWVCAWTLSALFLAFARLGLTFPPGWGSVKGIVVLIATLAGFLVAPILIFGALSFRPSRTIPRSMAIGALGAALVIGTLSYTASLQWLDEPLTSFAVRHAPRTLTLAGALFFSSWVFYQQARATRSWAAMLTSVSCFVYALDQCVYTGAQFIQLFGDAVGFRPDVGSLAMTESARLLYFDVLLMSGICLGTVLVVVEEYQRSQHALLISVTRGREVEDENTTLQLEILHRQQVESYDVEEILRTRLVDHLAPDIRGEFDDYLAAIRRDGVASGLLKVMTRSGQFRIWAFRNTLRTNGVAAPIVRGMARDVTEQRQAERALRLSEEKFAAAFRSSPCAMTITSLTNGCFIDVNESFERQMGFSKAEVAGRTSMEVGLWEDPAAYAAAYTEITEGRLFEREVLLRTKSGTMMTAELSATTITVDGVRCVLSVGVDVTARKQTEARHQAILKALPDWVFLTSDDGVFLEFHARDPRHLVMPPDDFIGRNVMDVLPVDLASRLLVCFCSALESDLPATLEYSLGAGDDQRFYEVRSVAAERNHVLSLVRDVTDRRRAEQRARDLQGELAHAGRVLALGTLTGSLAHEINQPLTAIATNAPVALGLLNAGESDHADIREALGDIASDSKRIDDVLRRLRLLLRKGRHERSLVDINDLVKDVLTLVHANLVQRRVAIDAELADDLPNVLGDRIQLQQVVLNILMNASEAVSAMDNPDDRYVKVTTEVRGSAVVVSITDRGMGVSDAALERMFHPFFTTKHDGMGLGLSICRSIIDAHAGRIAAVRNPDKGLTCWFSLDATAFSSRVAPGTSGPAVVESAPV
jgi:PAS domain S-box-containing protein